MKGRHRASTLELLAVIIIVTIIIIVLSLLESTSKQMLGIASSRHK